MHLIDSFKKVFYYISHIINSTVLSLIFLFLITPIAILSKAFKKNHMASKKKKHITSYWVKRNDFDAVKQSFRRQF